MALSHDGSGMGSYVQEGVAIWKYRMMLAFGALLVDFGFPRAVQLCQTAVYKESLPPAPPLALARPQLVGHSDYRHGRAARGPAVTNARPNTIISTASVTLDAALRVG